MAVQLRCGDTVASYRKLEMGEWVPVHQPKIRGSAELPAPAENAFRN